MRQPESHWEQLFPDCEGTRAQSCEVSFPGSQTKKSPPHPPPRSDQTRPPKSPSGLHGWFSFVTKSSSGAIVGICRNPCLSGSLTFSLQSTQQRLGLISCYLPRGLGKLFPLHSPPNICEENSSLSAARGPESSKHVK